MTHLVLFVFLMLSQFTGSNYVQVFVHPECNILPFRLYEHHSLYFGPVKFQLLYKHFLYTILYSDRACLKFQSVC